MEELLQQLTEKKQRLDSLQPFPQALIDNLNDWFRIELTYTSNAIEGNTLTRQETAQVVEKGITVEGKTIVEHQEAINHSKAYVLAQSLLQKKEEKHPTEQDTLEIHKIILHNIQDEYAGRYRNIPVRIAGSTVILPNYVKVPELMKDLFAWIEQQHMHPAKLAAEAHLRFESTHPFIDGNGRTGRILMNMILAYHGYPPALIRKEDRHAYINALEKAQTTHDSKDYFMVIYRAIDRSFDEYFITLENK